ncbi:SIR2 family protein [Stieleria sp. JC731]|uniref:SIR2 family protein n=1 Tax=Pirellulaceae TaxID=2691357 RepID=UPI001E620858|nr:SIR2 family protein [Stieleria sp. JC731]MCC9600737.1 SIR2 family protein [Stieleria sp. JC731]
MSLSLENATIGGGMRSVHESELNEVDFVERITQARNDGKGFVPLVGAGLSAASGVPLIRQIERYLHYCIAITLGVDQISDWDRLPEFQKAWRWHPQRDEWPPIDIPHAYKTQVQDWQRRIGDVAGRLSHLASTSNTVWKRYPEIKVFLEAYGATAEWRSALSFLSRLRENVLPEGRVLTLGAIDPHVYDNFFLNAVFGKTPTLGHRMLARLANPLGINTIVTLNFDDLLEQAFAETGSPLTVYGVHHEAGLPGYHSQFGKNVLVKMHGDRYGLRADYSLDEHPSEDDCRHFTSYLANRTITVDEWISLRDDSSTSRLKTRNHLLVTGLAVQEERILELIRRAASVLDDDFRVFWMVYLSGEIEPAAERLRNTLQSCAKNNEPKFAIIQHHFCGLLFYNLYQHLEGSLPPTGAIFPARARVAVPPGPLRQFSAQQDKTGSALLNLANAIDDRIAECFERNQFSNPRKLVVVSSPPGTHYGIVSASSRSFSNQLDRGRQAIWIDLDDVVDTDDLFEVMLHTIARAAGVVDWMPVLAQSNTNDLGMSRNQLSEARQQEILRITNNPDRQWVIYLNSRSGGAGSAFVSVERFKEFQKASGPNGWIDRVEPSEPDDFASRTGNSHEFLELLECISRDACPNVAIVLLCYGDNPQVNDAVTEAPAPISGSIYNSETMSNESDQQRGETESINDGSCGTTSANHAPLEDSIASESSGGGFPNLLGRDCRRVALSKSCFEEGLSTDGIAQKALDWVDNGLGDNSPGDSKARQRFLFALVSVNRVRSQSLLWSWAFHEFDNSESHYFAGRRKNSDQWSRELTELHVVRVQPGGFLWMQSDIRRRLRKQLRERYRNEPNVIPRVHQGIAEWYAKLHVSSRSARAATESAYHQLLRARFTLEQIGDRYNKQTDELVAQALQAFGSALRVLRQGRPSMLSDGYTQGTCRRLEDIRDKHCVDRIERRIFQNGIGEPSKARLALDDPGQVRGVRNSKRIDYAIAQVKATCDLRCFEISQEIGDNLKAFDQWKRMVHSSSDAGERGVRDQIGRVNRLISLGIAIRSPTFIRKTIGVSKSISQFKRVPTLAQLFDTSLSRNETVDQLRGELRKWLQSYSHSFVSNPCVSSVEDVKLQLAESVVKLLQRWMQAEICIGLQRKANALGSRFRGIPTWDQWRDAARIYEVAVELNRFVHRDALHFAEQHGDSNSSVRRIRRDRFQSWFDDQQRLDTQHALALAMTGDFAKAGRRLNEAEAALVELDAPEGLERAIIDLHRACITLWEAEKLGLADVQHKVTELVPKKLAHTATDSESLEKVLGSLQAMPLTITTKTRSLLEDAWQHLDRASPVLERYRKNAWWTTWNFELRMQLIEFEMYVSLIEKPNDSLPYVGTRFVPSRMPTQLDSLLDNSRRVIRMDLFRLARIVDSYAHCLLVLSLWRSNAVYRARNQSEFVQQSSTPDILLESKELEAREHDMISRLYAKHAKVGRQACPRGVGHSLADLLAARKQLDKTELEECQSRRAGGSARGTPVDSEVERYVRNTLKFCELVSKFSRINSEYTNHQSRLPR